MRRRTAKSTYRVNKAFVNNDVDVRLTATMCLRQRIWRDLCFGDRIFGLMVIIQLCVLNEIRRVPLTLVTVAL